MVMRPYTNSKTPSGEEIVSQLKKLESPNKLPATTIENAVLSVNSKTGNVKLTSEMVGAQPQNTNLTKIAQAVYEANSLMYTDKDNNIQSLAISDYMKNMLSLQSTESVVSKMQLSKVAMTGNYNDLENVPVQNDNGSVQVQSDWEQEDETKADFIRNKPAIPEIPEINYPVTSVNEQEGGVVLTATEIGAANKEHSHTIADITGLQSELDAKLDSGSEIDYSQITGVPEIPEQLQSDWTQEDSTQVDFIKNKPTIPVVNYPVTSVNDKTGAVSLGASDVGAAPVQHTHTITQITGLQTALDSKISTGASIPYSTITGKPTIPAAQVNSDWNATTGVTQILNKPTVPKFETLQGTTGSNGIYQVTFGKTYTTPPHVNPVVINGTAAQVTVLSNLTTTGCTISVQQRAAVTLLGLEVLLAATTAVANATVGVLVVARD